MKTTEPLHLSDTQAYNKTIEQVVQEFDTALDNGLSTNEANKRIGIVGKNLLPTGKRLSLIKLLLKQFQDFMVILLLVVSLVAFLIGDIKDCVIILIVVVINTILGFVQEYKAEKTIAALKKTASPKAKVIRNGKYQMIQTAQIAPGDILLVEEGDIVQADGRLFEVVNLATLETFLTGESLPISKESKVYHDTMLNIADHTNMVFRGSTIAKGHGKVIVTATGEKTELGKVAHLIGEIKDTPTPLESKLKILGKNLVLLTIILCLLVATVGILRGMPTLMMIKTAIVLGIACIPEGLVAVVTIALALGVQRMSRKKAIIRRLPAVESLGSITTICSDKTGTLTEGKMTAQVILMNDQTIQVTGSGESAEGEFLLHDEPIGEFSADLKLLLMIGTLCNNATLQQKGGQWETFGDPTEGALLVLGAKAGYFKDTLSHYETFIQEAPFETKRKCMSKIYQTASKQNSIISKGAPEQILTRCTQEQVNGHVQSLSESKREKIKSLVNDYAGKGFRILSFAYRDLDAAEDTNNAFAAEKDLIYIGSIAIADRLRDVVPVAIERCQKAGIRTMILTGDHPHTATYIGKKLGIVNENMQVGNSTMLESMNQYDFEHAMGKYNVISRMSPQIKLRIVEGLKNQGEIVAMTGDGINDAPAIRRANVGIAMGKTGTDVAKEAADIVLADDNFSTIVAAIEEGRSIYNNILKFIRYLLSCNMGEIFIMLIATFFALPLPFLPIQILWLNLVTDTPPALALGVEPVDPTLMHRKPRHPKERIFSHDMLNIILFHGFVMAILTLGIFVFELYVMKKDITTSRTVAFATLVFIQLLHAFNSQRQHKSLFSVGFFTNKYLIGAVFLSCALLVLSIHLPFLSTAFDLKPLTAIDWIHAAGTSILIILIVEIQKWIRSKKKPAELHQVF